MSDFSINIVPDSQTFINVIDDGQTVTINPLSFVDGLTINYISGDGSGELDHNTLLGLQGGSDNYFYHLNSGQYFNLATGSVIRPNETGAFYAASNPSGFVTGINNLVFTTGNQIISGAKTFSNNLVVGGNDLFVDTSTDRVGISTASPITTLDVNGSGLFRSGLNVSLITSTGSDFYLSGKDNATEFYPGSNIGGFVHLRGGSGTLVGGYIDLKGGDNAGIIRIQGGNGILENANLPAGQVLLSSFSTEFNRFNNYSSNVVFWKTGLSTMVENARVSQDSISINNNLLITGNRPTVNGTGILLSGEATTQSYVTGISGNLQTQITSLSNQTGNYALKSQTGSFITSDQTGVFYPISNPSGFITGSVNSFTITNVATNSNKLALTNIQNGHVVKITEESNRIEQYLSGSINSNDNWIILKNTINLFINNRSNTQVNVNGITCPSFVTTNVGWVDPISQITFLPQQSFIVDGISKYGSSNVYYEAGYNYASLAYDILNDGTVTITKKLPDRFSGVLFISNF